MRSKLRKKTYREPGESPGTLHDICNVTTKEIDITIINYDSINFKEKDVTNIEDCFIYTNDSSITWINVEGVHRHDILEKLGKHYGLHPLMLEDISSCDQRPKLDDYDEHIFIIVKMLSYNEEEKKVMAEQVSFVLGSNYVISFQEEGKMGDVFNPNRERLKNNKGKIRKSGADYLLYTLVDTVVDNYFIILETIGERIEELEGKLISDPSPEKLKTLYSLKREMINLRKSVWPLREVISKMEKGESDLIKPSTQVFIRDVYDHTIQVIDTVESYRDVLASMVDIYMSSISNRMNSVMKVLTIISTIFIPLTFVAGVYGMNFDYMPELKWKYGYLYVWIFMIISVCFMLIYFRRKKWL
jgi:magnesium transporter